MQSCPKILENNKLKIFFKKRRGGGKKVEDGKLQKEENYGSMEESHTS